MAKFDYNDYDHFLTVKTHAVANWLTFHLTFLFTSLFDNVRHVSCLEWAISIDANNLTNLDRILNTRIGQAYVYYFCMFTWQHASVASRNEIWKNYCHHIRSKEYFTGSKYWIVRHLRHFPHETCPSNEVKLINSQAGSALNVWRFNISSPKITSRKCGASVVTRKRWDQWRPCSDSTYTKGNVFLTVLFQTRLEPWTRV